MKKIYYLVLLSIFSLGAMDAAPAKTRRDWRSTETMIPHGSSDLQNLDVAFKQAIINGSPDAFKKFIDGQNAQEGSRSTLSELPFMYNHQKFGYFLIEDIIRSTVLACGKDVQPYLDVYRGTYQTVVPKTVTPQSPQLQHSVSLKKIAVIFGVVAVVSWSGRQIYKRWYKKQTPKDTPDEEEIQKHS